MNFPKSQIKLVKCDCGFKYCPIGLENIENEMEYIY
jgi:hypothetical protein